jgi:uncharacterized protein involved in exopolysaccharide biosynthesis
VDMTVRDERDERTRGSAVHQPGGVDGLILAVRRRLGLVALISVVFGIGFYMLTYWMTPIYRGTTILAPADLEKKSLGSGLSSALGSMGGFSALAGLGFGGSDTATEEAIAVLKSQELTEALIRQDDLLPELFPKQWDPASGHWKPGKKPPTIGAGFRAFNRIRKVQRDTKTGLITLTVDWKDPLKAAAFTNGLVDLLNEEMRQRALVQAEASVGYLQRELANSQEVSTREAISRLMEEEIKQEMVAHVTKQYSLRVVDAAIPADLDAPVRPIKILYAALGLVFGFCAGAWIAVRLGRRAAPAADQ